jgi:hypothetical protein
MGVRPDTCRPPSIGRLQPTKHREVLHIQSSKRQVVMLGGGCDDRVEIVDAMRGAIMPDVLAGATRNSNSDVQDRGCTAVNPRSAFLAGGP